MSRRAMAHRQRLGDVELCFFFLLARAEVKLPLCRGSRPPRLPLGTRTHHQRHHGTAVVRSSSKARPCKRHGVSPTVGVYHGRDTTKRADDLHGFSRAAGWYGSRCQGTHPDSETQEHSVSGRFSWRRANLETTLHGRAGGKPRVEDSGAAGGGKSAQCGLAVGLGGAFAPAAAIGVPGSLQERGGLFPPSFFPPRLHCAAR